MAAGVSVRVTGGCHCGAVRFEADVADVVEVHDCNCSICAKSGFLHLIVPHEEFRLLTDPSALTSYRFGTGAADHLFCSTCGIKSFYQPRSHPDAWSINYRGLDEGVRPAVTIRPFDGRDWEAARAALAEDEKPARQPG